jgi:hypothetical protein
MKYYEAHLNIAQKVFVDDRILYTTVLVKLSHHENKNLFVYVNCFYATVGLIIAVVPEKFNGHQCK